jgi:hypothetical protein
MCNEHAEAAADYGEISSLARAETSSVEKVVAWQEQRHSPEVRGVVSPLRGQPDGEATICMYRGSFVTPTAPLAEGGRAPAHDMLRLIIRNGEVIFDSAGYEGRMAPDTPSDFE